MHSAILRALVFLAAAAVIGAATHANVMHAGGYSSEGAPLAIAIAALLTIGMGFVGKLWEDRRRFVAIFIALCFICGEAYGWE